jgi:signal transduction histidine kinase
MVSFISMTLLVTAMALSFFNQQLERRTTLVVEEYIRDITLATDIVYRSFSSGKYLYDLVNLGSPESLTITDESVIRHLLVVDQEGLVFDSSSQADLGQPYQAVLEASRTWAPGDLRLTDGPANGEARRTLNFSIETERGIRRIFIVISMNRLGQVKETGDRVRLILFVLLGAGLITAIFLFTRRFTRPITGLGEAARRVTAGELDFEVPVDGPPEVSRLSATFNDMLAGLRRSRDLEEELQRAERSAVVGRLASGIAHEIRNPLNFINLSIDYLRDKYPPAAEPGRAEYTRILTTIKDELARLNRLVSDFLSYGRTARLKCREIDVRALIEEVRDLVSTRTTQQNVEIVIESTTPQVTLLADPEQLKTCFSNIMINAVQAMPGGGQLRVTLDLHPDQLQIDFTDTGHGMTAEMCEQVFEPYFSTRETGIGLGLALTRKIVEEHGGRISVESHPDRGTTFHIIIPRRSHGSAGTQ